eukprot:1903017-Alexandrium_andersonii.AAC.1
MPLSSLSPRTAFSPKAESRLSFCTAVRAMPASPVVPHGVQHDVGVANVAPPGALSCASALSIAPHG